MSTQPKRYEGAAIEPLLEQVHRDLGPEARIVNAEKVRSGGYLGFFAREAYRLEVSPPENGSTTPAARSTTPAARSTTPAPGSIKPAATSDPVATPSPVASSFLTVAAAQTSLTDDPFAALAAQADDVVEVAASFPVVTSAMDDTATLPVVTRATNDTATLPVVTRATDDTVDGTDQASPRPTEAMSRIAQALSKPAAAGATWLHAITGSPTAIDDATSSDRRNDADDEAEEFAAVLRRVVIADAATPDGPGNPPAVGRRGSSAPVGGLDATGDPVELENQLDEIARFLAEQSTTPAGTAAIGSNRTDTTRTGSTSRSVAPLARALRRIGLSDDAARAITAAVGTGQELGHVLLDYFSSLPAPPPLPHLPGGLLVVVGDGERAFELAAEFAAEIDIDPDAVYLASASAGLRRRLPTWRCVGTTEEAAERAPGWRRNGVAVVAIDAPLAGNSTSWARRVIDTLKATAVWGAVEAVHKPDDIAAWADALGGMDALVLDNIASTISPLSITATGIVVARVAGHRASAARWATLVMDRVKPCA